MFETRLGVAACVCVAWMSAIASGGCADPVTQDDPPVTIEITSPAEGAVVAERRVRIRGRAENAEQIARGLDAEVVPIPEMAPVIRAADLIVGAAFAPHFIVTREMFERVRGEDSDGRRICLIDAAVPRILDRGIGELEGVTRLDMGDLEEIVRRNREKRLAAAPGRHGRPGIGIFGFSRAAADAFVPAITAFSRSFHH